MDLRPGYFRIEVASHSIFYVMRNGIPYVIRVLHKRMDPSRYL